MASKPRWVGGQLILGGSVVGTILRLRYKQWEAYGCAADWQDVPLGIHEHERLAKQVVEDWVESHEN